MDILDYYTTLWIAKIMERNKNTYPAGYEEICRSIWSSELKNVLVEAELEAGIIN